MKTLKGFSEAYGRHDAYTRDYHSSVSGMGKRQSAAYHADGGANDEGWGDEHHSRSKPADHPHSVHINGKKWKTFGSHSHATNVARKIKGATVHKEEVEIQEDQTTSEFKIKKFVGQDGKTHQRKVRPHTVHFKNSKSNAEPEQNKDSDDKENMKKEQLELSSFTTFLEGYVVKYHDEKGQHKNTSRVFDDKSKADAHATKGNSIDKVGGKYTVHKIDSEGRSVKEETQVEEQAPVAPTIDRKYIKGTPEWKAHKEKSKPINGHPTNNVKEEAVTAAQKHVKEETMKSYKQFVESLEAAKVSNQIEEEIVEEEIDEANAFDWKSGGHKTSGKYDVKQVGNRTIVTRKYDPETGHSTGTDEPESTEKRGRGRPAGSKSGAKQKGSGKSNDYRGIATHSLNLPNTK